LKILVLSRTFLPTIGGLEVRVAQLVEAWAAKGLQVTVATSTAGPRQDGPYRVVRRPSRWQQLGLFQWADIVYQPNLSLRDLWPFALVRRPWVVSHHSWYTRTDGSVTLADRLKRASTRRADVSIAVSHALAADLGPETIVIPNPYRQDLFRLRPEVERKRRLLFVGRLVSDKGLDILLDALGLLVRRGLVLELTVVGSGPELEAATEQARRLGLGQQVDFVGSQLGEELAITMNSHTMLIVPSRYREPFGIVAVEAIASGCVVVGSEDGGLREAIGPCGVTFPNGDAGALADRIENAWGGSQTERLLLQAATHLAPLRGHVVADRYVAIFRSLVG
jgi:glycogen(starch) synthase